MGRRSAAADDVLKFRQWHYMAEGFRPSPSELHEAAPDACSLGADWASPSSTSPTAGVQPPPGKRAASAYRSQSHQADFVQSTINLVTCVLGAGALGYPFCFKECGLLLATVIMFVTLVATRISYLLLLYCAQLSGRKSYESIAEHALGKTGRQVVEFCIAAMNLGALVAFLDILADVLSSVAGTIIPPGAEPSRHAYITGVTLVGALPISLLVREPSLIANMSNAAVVFVVVFAVVVFFTAFGPSAAAALGVRWAAITHSTAAAAAPVAAAVQAPILHMWNPQGVLVSLPVMAYGFTAHQYYMGIYSMLRAPTMRKMKLVTDAALLVCAGVYWTVGVGGYATFGERTAGDIIRNFGGQRAVGMWGAYERALKLCYGMAVLGNIPLVILPFCSILAPLLPGDDQIKQQTSSLTAACTVAGAKRATAAALTGCSSGVPLHKARYSGSSSGRPFASDGGAKCAGGELAVQLGGEALVLEAPVWHQHSAHDLSSSSGAGTPLQSPLLAQQQHQQQQDLESLLASPPPRVASPEEAPAHPHLPRDAGRTAHMLTGPQHTLVVVLVLGMGLASALWLPNVELIFGLTGSTASVLAAFIMPALCFLRLYETAPELGGSSTGSSTGSAGLWQLLQHALSCWGCCSGLSSLLFGWSSRPRYRSLGPRGGRLSSPGASKSSSSSSSAWGQQQGLSSSSNGEAGGLGPGSPVHQVKVWGPVLVVPELRALWACRQRLAFVLLAFGLLSGLLCTDAILSSISEEKAVVQLAQELVAHEVVVAETSRAQQKAKEAAAAVDAVSSAAQQLHVVDTTTNQTLGSLTAAAAALNTIAGPKASSHSSSSGDGHGIGHGGWHHPQSSVWDFKGRLEQHKQKVAEDSVLRNVEAALSTAAADIAATTASVTAVIIKLDTSIAQIKADAAAAAAAAAVAPVHPDIVAGGTAGGPAAVGLTAPDGSLVLPAVQAGAGSSSIIPHAGSTDADSTTDTQQQQQQAAAAAGGGAGAAPVAGAAAAGPAKSAAAGGSSRSSDAYTRANEMAKELGQALGSLGVQSAADANATLTAGKSLEQVRDSAIAALTALNVTADVLKQVRGAVAAARHAQQRDSQVKDVAVRAMQRALNATAASALAMRITREALGTAATEETSELLTALTKVAQDIEKSDSAAAGSHKRASITVSSDDSSIASSGGASSAAAAAGAGTAPPAPGASSSSGSGSSTSGAATAGPDSAAAAGGASTGAGAGVAAASGPASAATAGSSSSSAGGSTPVVPASQPAAQPQPLAKHHTLAEHEAAAGAAANAAAHAESESTNDQQRGSHGTATPAAGTTAESTAGMHAAAAGGVGTASGAAQVQPAAAGTPAAADTATATGQQASSSSTQGSSGGATDSSGSSTAAGGSGAAQQPAAAAAGSNEGGGVSVLTASEASKVKDVIGHLASALSTSTGSSSSTGSGPQIAPAAANITQLAAAIHDAVAWTQQSKSAVMNLIVKDLGETDPKVAQRVVGIVQEVSTAEAEAGRQVEQHKAVAAAAAALDVASVTETSHTGQQQQQAQQPVAAAGNAGQQAMQQPQQGAAAGAAAVLGPAVAVQPAAGQQQQQPGVGSLESGPIHAAATVAAAAAQSVATVDHAVAVATTASATSPAPAAGSAAGGAGGVSTAVGATSEPVAGATDHAVIVPMQL